MSGGTGISPGPNSDTGWKPVPPLAAARRLGLLVFLTLMSCYGYFFPRWAEWNQNSRIDLTRAIVEQGTIRIDAYYENTGDYAVYGGHVYTDKAPGTSFLGVPAYFVFRLLSATAPIHAVLDRLAHTEALARTLREGGTGLLEHKVYSAAALYFTTFVTVSVSSAMLGLLLYFFLGRLMAASAPRALLALAYGLATVAFPYSTVFYGNQVAAALLFGAFCVLYRIRRHELTDRWLWVAGGMQGLAVLIEFPALIAAGLMALYTLWFLDCKAALLKMVWGALPLAVLLGWYNAAAFGSPFASSYGHLARFAEISHTGFLGFTRPSLSALCGLTFSPYRGLFFLSPFVLLSVPGFWLLLRQREWRAEAVLWLGILLAHLLLISSWYDWRGGFAIGPRNLLPILPFAMMPITACYRACRQRPALAGVVWILVALSFVSVWIASVSGQEFAPLDIANPLVAFFWPRFRAGDITRNLGMALGLPAWWSLLPLAILLGLAVFLIWRYGTWPSRDPGPMVGRRQQGFAR